MISRSSSARFNRSIQSTELTESIGSIRSGVGTRWLPILFCWRWDGCLLDCGAIGPGQQRIKSRVPFDRDRPATGLGVYFGEKYYNYHTSPAYLHTAVFAAALDRPTAVPHDLFAAIRDLKRELNAVILAHYYQESEIQDIADYIGDSLGLSQQAAQTDADVIVFAGVHFMAETAKILNPHKQVLLPDLEAGCSLADSCPASEFAAFKARYPDHLVISYINCTAEIKALSDIICTSSNAVKIVQQIPPEQPIIFAPDRNLGRYVMQQTGREMVLWDGSCIVHETFSEQKLVQLQVQYPEAEVIAHPECEPPLLRHASFIGSTTALLNHVQRSDRAAFIVATEPGILHQMQKAEPQKQFIPAPPEGNCACNECPHMRLNTLEKLYFCMKTRSPEITMDESVRSAALQPIQRMLAMS